MSYFKSQFKKTANRGKEKTLWRWFSLFIRLRDSHDGWATCITCGTIKPWREMDAGHFVTRNHWVTKYDSRNVHSQCKRCNRFQSGNQYIHGIEIDKRHGRGTAEHLSYISRMKSKRDPLWIEASITEFKAKARFLAEQKGIEL